ncbi:MAG: M23 family metallopeptidase [Fibrobacteraceae bacterium]|nr:M23 family metallopeptidase [Fibrobacteraceae bacterium]
MKKLEIHVFPGKTTSAKSYKLSFTRAVVSVLAVLFAVVGFIIFSPTEIIDNITNGSVFDVFRQNAQIKKEIKGIRAKVDESILRAEETKLLRDSTIKLGGLSFVLDEGYWDESYDLDMPRKSLYEMEKSFKTLIAKLEEDSLVARSIPILHPLKNKHTVKNRFDIIFDPYTEQSLPHRGIDYAAAEGDTVYATGGGTVLEVRSHRGFGLTVKIDHVKKVRSFYAHLGVALVRQGTKVKRGDPIALIGPSGRESSMGLHYEIRLDGTPINPEEYFITK